MPRKFDELTSKMSKASRERVMKRVEREVARMPLHQIRQARKLTQEQIALQLDINQAAVSKLERRADMYVSTLRNFVRALGGDLEILATFPDGQVNVSNFTAVDLETPDDLVLSSSRGQDLKKAKRSSSQRKSKTRSPARARRKA